MKKIILEFDDLHWDPSVDCMVTIDKLVRHIPNIILNFFVPIKYNNQPLTSNKEWLARLKDYINRGNIKIGIHGYLHSPEEFKRYGYHQAYDILELIDEELSKNQIAYQKVFRGPHWGINEKVVQALIDNGYTHLYSHQNYKELNSKFENNIKIVYYNWNLKDKWPILENSVIQNDIIVAHGHTSIHPHLNCNNGIHDISDYLIGFLKENSLEFVSLEDI